MITLSQVFFGISILVILYFVAVNSVYLVSTVFAFFALRRHSARMMSFDLDDLITSGEPPPVTLLVPAYNEEVTVVSAVRSLLTLNYTEYDVVVINDGSTDRTLDVLAEEFNLAEADRVPTGKVSSASVRAIYRSRRYSNLWVIDKENGGKSDALNAGLRFCQTPLFCALDADTLLERDALIRIVRPFLEDGATVAAGGILRIGNGCVVEDGQIKQVRLPRQYLARLQVVEYMRAFLAGRMGWDAVGASLIISGAFGMFRRATVVAAGGYSTDTVGEDMELIVRLHRHCRESGGRYRIAFVPDPVAWTECPATMMSLGRQRRRWQRGMVQTLFKHRKMLFNHRYGRIGMVAFPYFFFLEMMGPAIEVLGYTVFIYNIWQGAVFGPFVIAFILLAVVLGVVLSVAAVALEELTFRRYPSLKDLLSLFALALWENLGFRQAITIWRFLGIIEALRGIQTWGGMGRRGFTEDDGQTNPVAVDGAES